MKTSEKLQNSEACLNIAIDKNQGGWRGRKSCKIQKGVWILQTLNLGWMKGFENLQNSEGLSEYYKRQNRVAQTLHPCVWILQHFYLRDAFQFFRFEIYEHIQNILWILHSATPTNILSSALYIFKYGWVRQNWIPYVCPYVFKYVCSPTPEKFKSWKNGRWHILNIYIYMNTNIKIRFYPHLWEKYWTVQLTVARISGSLPTYMVKVLNCTFDRYSD